MDSMLPMPRSSTSAQRRETLFEAFLSCRVCLFSQMNEMVIPMCGAMNIRCCKMLHELFWVLK